MGDTSLESWVDETSTTALLVQVAGETVIEIDRPTNAPGWIGFDGAPNLGEPEGGTGLPFEPLPDGRMRHDIASGQKSVIAVLVAIGAERILSLSTSVKGGARRPPTKRSPSLFGISLR